MNYPTPKEFIAKWEKMSQFYFNQFQAGDKNALELSQSIGSEIGRLERIILINEMSEMFA